MKNGLYEMPILSEYKKDKYMEKELIEFSEMPKILSKNYEVMLRKKLESLDKKDIFDFYKEYYRLLNDYDESVDSNILLAVHNEEEKLKEISSNRPSTSIAFSSLLTGKKGEPTLVHELIREIRTSESIDMLVSFVKYSGLRLIFDDLIEFTKTKKLRIITTSYMGASDYKAIEKLSFLPNTEVKVTFDTERTRLHAKAYYFERYTGFSTAYIGSSNLSNVAISSGLEWNVKISEYTSLDVINKFKGVFDSYWNDDEFITFDSENEDLKIKLKEALGSKKSEVSLKYFDLKPYPFQIEILDELEVERNIYNSFRNLIVSATGTGKTMISAFDYKKFRIKNKTSKLLFIAHRKEILEQSLSTFRMVLKDQNFGELWTGKDELINENNIFATVQILASKNNYEKYPKDYFDYIILDETHHAAASTYLKLIDYYNPKILLGLTATPERMDSEDITKHFNNRIASEIRLTEAINRKLLSPFHYFGVTDSVDLGHMQFKRGKYLPKGLENIYIKSDQRINVILKSLEKYVTDIDEMKALGFCVTKVHARYMANKFNEVGIPSINLDSDSSQEIRTTAKAKLLSGEIKCIFVVDLYNEGVDIPEIDTVLFLRPTESLTVFLQQFGRGLRLSDGKETLTVLDYVGHAHKQYDFSLKFRALIGKSKKTLKEEIENEFPNMPVGCSIKLEKIAMEHILKNIQSAAFNKNSLKNMIRMFNNNFEMELNLENFLQMHHIDLVQFYAKYSFYELLNECDKLNDYSIFNVKNRKIFFRRLSVLNSYDFLKYIKDVFNDEEISEEKLEDKNMIAMLYYTIFTELPEGSYIFSLNKFIKKNKSLVDEAIEMIRYKLKHLKLIEKKIELNYELPLDIYADYHLDQILAALNVHKENKKFPLRQGVFYVKEKQTDIFFITINKMEGDYLESTMYNDYAISNELFHWESQSTTSITSNTGKRYINDKSEEHVVLLFVRETKKIYGGTNPYTFLGRARYVSHSGSKPIKIIWRLDNKIPQRIIRKSNLKLVE